MECSEFKVLLRGLLDGGLGAENRARMERHMSQCLPCREDSQATRELDLTLTEALTPPALSFDLTDRIMATVDSRSVAQPRRMLRMWTAVAAAACFLCAIIGMAILGAKKAQPSMQVLDGSVEATTDGQNWRPLAADNVTDFSTPCVYRATRDGEVRFGDTTLRALDGYNSFRVETVGNRQQLHVLFGRFQVSTQDNIDGSVQLCAAGGVWQAQGQAQWLLEIPSLPQMFDENSAGVAAAAFLNNGEVCYVNASGHSNPLEQKRKLFIQTDGQVADRRKMNLQDQDGSVEILEHGNGCFELMVSFNGHARTFTYSSPVEFRRKLPDVYMQYASLDELGFGDTQITFDDIAECPTGGNVYTIDDHGTLIAVPDLSALQQDLQTAHCFLSEVHSRQKPIVRNSLARVLSNAKNPYKISADGSGSITVHAWVNDEQVRNDFASLQELFLSLHDTKNEAQKLVIALQNAQDMLHETQLVFIAGAVLTDTGENELPADAPSAVTVLSVTPDSLLAKAQFATGDIILRRKDATQGWVITSVDDMQVQLSALPAGQSLVLDGLRDGKNAMWVVKK